VTRRTVRVDQQFFTELDAQLGETRGPNGEPSASDFLLIELPTIADTFGERFDELLRRPLNPGDSIALIGVEPSLPRPTCWDLAPDAAFALRRFQLRRLT
jgi:hypothetical protein